MNTKVSGSKSNKKGIALALKAAVQMSEKGAVLNGESAEVFLKKIPALATKVSLNHGSEKSKIFNARADSLISFESERIRFFGTITELSEEMSILLNDEDGEETDQDSSPQQTSFVTVSIESAGLTIHTIPVHNKKIIHALKKSKKDLMKVYGTVVLVPTSKYQSRAQLFIDKIKPATKMIEILSPPDEVIKRAEKILKEKRNDLFNYLFKSVTGTLNIVTSGTDPMSEAIRGGIVSTVSEAYFNDRNGRVHVAFFGPPGCGKEKLGKVVSLLSPIYFRADSAKLSIAGLLASSSFDAKTGNWASKKGFLAKAHRGAFHIEDLHMMPQTELGKVLGSVSTQMENASVTDGTSAMVEHAAATSIILDWNLGSQVDKTKNYSPHEEFPLPGNIISRLDLIFELLSNVAKDRKQINPMVQAHFGERIEHDAKNELLLKTITALLIDRFPKIELSGVRDFVTKKIKEFHDANLDLMDDSDDFNSNYNRMFKSAAKLTSSHARLHQRSVAIKEDAEFALEMLALKFKSLRRIIPDLKASKLIVATSKERRLRQAWLIKDFGGQEISIEKALKAYSLIHKRPITDRTMRRDLDIVGKPLGRGLWLIRKP